jgi:hypothetical protein
MISEADQTGRSIALVATEREYSTAVLPVIDWMTDFSFFPPGV